MASNYTPSTTADGIALAEVFFDESTDAIVVVDEGGTIVVVNHAVEILTGYQGDAIRGQNVSLLVPARFADHERQRRSYQDAPAHRPMGRGLELAILHADGHEIPVDISLTPLVAGRLRVTACTIRDLRGRSYGEETMRVQATALNSAASGIVITDRNGTITWVNPAACNITGYAAAELVGQHTRILKSGRHDQDFYKDLWTTVTSGKSWSGTIVNRRRDGTLYDEEQTIAPVLDSDGEVSHFIAIKQDVTENRRLQRELARARDAMATQLEEIKTLNQKLHEQTIRDPLTQLHNRRYFREVLERDIAHAARSGNPLALAMIDIDRFKQINDTYGHAVGDLVLQHVAEVLRTNVRIEDLLCRIGGEEFVVVMPGATLDNAIQRAEQWRTALTEKPTKTAGQIVPCTVSIGVALYRAADPSANEVLERADRALYAAKNGGRNRVCHDDGVERKA